ncbi:rCG51514 [Rattus norvegicus]|uniref:RCG51514 n=1 Tax=Rattus norvegicus TaxID=10116 RepID=A6IY61_RAT|nr:rCG51514 [Rattus norvegicus]
MKWLELKPSTHKALGLNSNTAQKYIKMEIRGLERWLSG